jgi:hypothetical protein
LILRNGKRFVDLRADTVTIRMEKEPNELYPFALHLSVPTEAKTGQTYEIFIAQRNERSEAVGGAGVIYRVRA